MKNITKQGDKNMNNFGIPIIDKARKKVNRTLDDFIETSRGIIAKAEKPKKVKLDWMNSWYDASLKVGQLKRLVDSSIEYIIDYVANPEIKVPVDMNDLSENAYKNLKRMYINTLAESLGFGKDLVKKVDEVKNTIEYYNALSNILTNHSHEEQFEKDHLYNFIEDADSKIEKSGKLKRFVNTTIDNLLFSELNDYEIDTLKEYFAAKILLPNRNISDISKEFYDSVMQEYPKIKQTKVYDLVKKELIPKINTLYKNIENAKSMKGIGEKLIKEIDTEEEELKRAIKAGNEYYDFLIDFKKRNKDYDQMFFSYQVLNNSLKDANLIKENLSIEPIRLYEYVEKF